MKIFTRKKTILAAIEATYGVDAVPTGALNAIQTSQFSMQPLQGDALKPNLDKATFGADLSDLVGKNVVLTFNGNSLENVDALGYRLATQPIGTTAQLGVLSKGEQKTVDIVLERAPEGAAATQVVLRGRSPFAGAKVALMSPRLAQRLGMNADIKGVTVVDVDPNSPAADFGFQPGDIVREVNGATIDSAQKLEQAVAQNTRWWRFTVERNGQLMRQMLRY